MCLPHVSSIFRKTSPKTLDCTVYIYIYIYIMFIFCPHGSIAVADQDLPLSRFHDHTVIHTTFGRTPLDE